MSRKSLFAISLVVFYAILSGACGIKAALAENENNPSAEVEWTTVATLRSSDSHWQGLENILVGSPFSVQGDLKVVLNMPEAGPIDGVIALLVPADKVSNNTDGSALLAAIRDGITVMVSGAAPHSVVPGLGGDYVLINSVPAPKEWTIELQTKR